MDQVLLNKAMEMPPQERVLFAELMLASIEHEADDIRQSWIDEVNSRIEAVNSGKAKLLDFDELYGQC